MEWTCGILHDRVSFWIFVATVRLNIISSRSCMRNGFLPLSSLLQNDAVDFPGGIDGVLDAHAAAGAREGHGVHLEEPDQRGGVERAHVHGHQGGQAGQVAVVVSGKMFFTWIALNT